MRRRPSVLTWMTPIARRKPAGTRTGAGAGAGASGGGAGGPDAPSSCGPRRASELKPDGRLWAASMVRIEEIIGANAGPSTQAIDGAMKGLVATLGGSGGEEAACVGEMRVREPVEDDCAFAVGHVWRVDAHVTRRRRVGPKERVVDIVQRDIRVPALQPRQERLGVEDAHL